MTAPLRFGLLGCGRVAGTHRDAIASLGQSAELVAVCDVNPEALARFNSSSTVAAFGALADMLSDADLDVLSVCTPSGLHADHAVLAAEAGVHVLVEKPRDVTLEAVERMKAACRKAGVHLFPVFQNRFNPTIQLLKEAIDTGRFGKLVAVNSTVIWSRRQSYYDLGNWRGTRAMDGGAFMNQGIHFIDAMRYLGGEVKDVQFQLVRRVRNIECEDTGSALFTFENGSLGNIFVTMAGTSDQEGSLTVLGETGMVKVGGVAMNEIETWEFDKAHPEQDQKALNPQVSINSVYGNGHQAVYHRVAEHLQGGNAYPITVEDAQKSLELVLRCYREL